MSKTIKSFKDKRTQQIAENKPVKNLDKAVQKKVRSKIQVLDNITKLQELKIPASNKFERLWREYPNRYSIRINNQYRLCFDIEKKPELALYNVEFTDYH